MLACVYGTLRFVTGNQQLAAFFATGLANTTQNCFNIALTFTAPNGNLSANNETGRHLLQDVALDNFRDSSCECLPKTPLCSIHGLADNTLLSACCLCATMYPVKRPDSSP